MQAMVAKLVEEGSLARESGRGLKRSIELLKIQLVISFALESGRGLKLRFTPVRFATSLIVRSRERTRIETVHVAAPAVYLLHRSLARAVED